MKECARGCVSDLCVALCAGPLLCVSVSYFTWSLRGLLINEQLDLEYLCDAGSLVPCQFPDGEAALALYDMSGTANDKWLCVLWMGLFLFAFNAVAAYSMAFVDLSAHDHDEEPDFQPANIKREKKPQLKPAAAAAVPAAAVAPDLEAGPVAPHAQADAGVASGIAPVAGLDAGPVNHGGYISWRNLNYTVEVDGAERHRQLLHGVYGYATPGMMVALMGQSGAGKVSPAQQPSSPARSNARCEDGRGEFCFHSTDC